MKYVCIGGVASLEVVVADGSAVASGAAVVVVFVVFVVVDDGGSRQVHLQHVVICDAGKHPFHLLAPRDVRHAGSVTAVDEPVKVVQQSGERQREAERDRDKERDTERQRRNKTTTQKANKIQPNTCVSRSASARHTATLPTACTHLRVGGPSSASSGDCSAPILLKSHTITRRSPDADARICRHQQVNPNRNPNTARMPPTPAGARGRQANRHTHGFVKRGPLHLKHVPGVAFQHVDRSLHVAGVPQRQGFVTRTRDEQVVLERAEVYTIHLHAHARPRSTEHALRSSTTALHNQTARERTSAVCATWSPRGLPEPSRKSHLRTGGNVRV